MSPQFVDFNADGHLDIVAGTYDGSPHVAWGTGKGWKQPEQILDRDGARIMMNAFWNFDSKKWEQTHRCDPEGSKDEEERHLTSAWAYDWDADGDLDLLLGDHRKGSVMLRRNEGSAKEHKFALRNDWITLDGKPLEVAGTVTTLRTIDWNGDGRQDLLVGSMGEAFGDGGGAGVYVYLDTSKQGVAKLAAPLTLIAPSNGLGKEVTRPNAGLYMEAGDIDGDGDLDLLVGGYSMWSPEAPKLTDVQKERVKELQQRQRELNTQMQKFYEELEKSVAGLAEEAAMAKRKELMAAKKDELAAQGKERAAVQQELEPLVPGNKRKSFTWLYENQAKGRAAAGGSK